MADRPNILMIFTDQQRFDTIHALGNPIIRTPNLDRLANHGVAFTSCYTPSPECVPARCSLHFGQYPMNSNCFKNGSPMPPADTSPTFMSVLQDAGYATHGIGKCHFKPRNALLGFDAREMQEEIPSRNSDDYTRHLSAEGFDHAIEPHGVRGEMYYIPQVSLLPERLHPTQWIGDRSVDYIQGRAGTTQPWLLFASFIHPHPPFSPPTPWHKLYRASDMPLPKVPDDVEHLYTWVNRNQNRYKYRDQGIDNNLLRLMKAHYYACISFIDYQVGRLLATLEATGQLDNTLILFSADHGELLGDYHCFGKRSMHDSASRVPLLAHLPGRFAGGARCDLPVSLIDLAPTMTAAAGADTPAGWDGVDLQTVVSGTCPRDAVHVHSVEGDRAIYTTVTDQWKYAYSVPDRQEFLFDRVCDPAETRNRAHLHFKQDDLRSLRARTQDWLRPSAQASVALDASAPLGWREYPPPPPFASPDDNLLIQDPADLSLQFPV